MKEGIHPRYQYVVFRDASCDKSFLTRSTKSSSKTIKWEDGNTYPLINIDISSYSHPFYTGQQRLLDSAGRVDRFQTRYKKTGGKTVVRKARGKRAVTKMSKNTKKILSNTPRVAPPPKKSKSKSS